MPVTEHGCLTLEQQSKLMSEIDAVAKLEDDELAEANAEEIRQFIDMLFSFGFIRSDHKVRYLGGLDAAWKRREKNA